MAQSPGICTDPLHDRSTHPKATSGEGDTGDLPRHPLRPPHPVLAGRPATQPPSLTLRSPLSLATYHWPRNPLHSSKPGLNLISSKEAFPIPASGIHLSRPHVPL